MLKDFILDIFFPRFCFGCQKEGEYLCQDCRATLDFTKDFYCLCEEPKIVAVPGKCPDCKDKNLAGLYFPFSYQDPLVKNLICYFKYEPFLKDLAKLLGDCLRDYFFLLEEKPDFSGFLVLPLPLDKARLKWRGFNQAKEVAKYFCQDFNLEIREDILFKVKRTKPQMELAKKERLENIKGAFLVKNKEVVQNRQVLLIDDVYTTGSTMEEAARVLKEVNAKEVWGLVLAREKIKK